jgi:tRNA threonylcarbamoyl adenosine modification protein YjeE
MHKKVILDSEEDTDKLANDLAPKLKLGDVIALYGELGAGKTFFTQRLCFHMGIKEIVSSPSYVLMNDYAGKIPVSHLDLYRIGSTDELLELGLYDLFEDRITIIEWPEIAENLLPEQNIKIRFEFEISNRIAFIDSYIDF